MVCKISLEQKLSIRTAHHIFVKNRQPEVTKIHTLFCPPRGAKKKVSADGLIPVCRGVYIDYFKINPPLSAVLCFLNIIPSLKSGSTKW